MVSGLQWFVTLNLTITQEELLICPSTDEESDTQRRLFTEIHTGSQKESQGLDLGRESTCSAGDTEGAGSIPRSEEPLEMETATRSCSLALKIPMERGAWQAVSPRVTKSRTMSD